MDSKVNGGTTDLRFVFRVDPAPRDVEAVSFSEGKTVITDTSTTAVVGDLLRFEDGAYQYVEVPVVEVTGANTVVLAGEYRQLVGAETFYYLRRATQRVDDTGAQLVVSSNGPTQFVLDNVDTEVEEDTVTPANSRPFPVKVMANGDDINFGAGASGAQTLRVVANIQRDGNELSYGAGATDANTQRVLLASEQADQIGATNEAAPGTDTATSGLNGRLQRIAQRITSLIALLPASLGQKASAASLAVVLSTEQEAEIGATNEAAPGTDTAASGLNGRLQRIAQRLTSLIALVPASLGQKASAASFAVTLSTEQEAEIGATNEAAPGTDTATSGLNGRLQRIAQRLTSLIALLPASLGQKASAASLAVVLSTEQEAEIGATNEAAPGTDTATSGLNGRLQRIAQRLTSLIALVPASLGQKTMANSFAVTLASDQTTIPTTATPAVPAAVTVKNAAITVGTSAVRATTDNAAPSSTRQKLSFQASTANTGNIYLGASGVTTATGMPIFPGQIFDYTMDANDYYLISDTAAQTVYIVEAE